MIVLPGRRSKETGRGDASARMTPKSRSVRIAGAVGSEERAGRAAARSRRRADDGAAGRADRRAGQSAAGATRRRAADRSPGQTAEGGPADGAIAGGVAT